MRLRISVIAFAVTALAIAVSATAGSTREAAVSGNVSMIGIWTGPEQKSFQAILDAFEKKYPDVDGQVHLGRRQHADDPLDGRPGREPAGSRGRRPAGPRPRLREPRRDQADRVRARRRSRRTTRATG